MTFDPRHHLGFLTNRVGRLIALSLEQELAKEGICMPVSCIGILADLWQSDGLSQTELGMSSIKPKSSINKMVQHLIDADLVEKREDVTDARKNQIFLTEKGNALKSKINMKSNELNLQLSDCISEHDILTTYTTLWKIYELLLSKHSLTENHHE